MEGVRRREEGVGGVGLTEEDTGDDDDLFLETGLEGRVSVDGQGRWRDCLPERSSTRH